MRKIGWILAIDNRAVAQGWVSVEDDASDETVEMEATDAAMGGVQVIWGDESVADIFSSLKDKRTAGDEEVRLALEEKRR
jgi:hypothetical protein